MRDKSLRLKMILPRIKNVVYSGTQIQLYSIGWLSVTTRLANVTLRGWEKRGILPKPMFVLSGNIRMYTAMEIEEFTRIIDAHFRGGRKIPELRRKLREASMKSRKEYTEASIKRLSASLVVSPMVQSIKKALTQNENTILA